jgi:hypothetical protein
MKGLRGANTRKRFEELRGDFRVKRWLSVLALVPGSMRPNGGTVDGRHTCTLLLQRHIAPSDN